MICILARHGKDDESVRGGWSKQPLSEEGMKQARELAERLMDSYSPSRIYSSDLVRAVQTAQIVGDRLGLSVTYLPGFREVNNGLLAGMKNDLAQDRFPGLYWNQLAWEQSYPEGESPKAFYERIADAWERFSCELVSGKENVLLVTHGGVIQVILSLINNVPYTNKAPVRKIPYAGTVVLTFEDGKWMELEEANGGERII